MDADSNDATNSSVKSMPDLYLPEKALHVPRPTSTDLILQDDDKPEILTMSIVKGSEGFGFTIADSAYGQKVSITSFNTLLLIIPTNSIIFNFILRLKRSSTSNAAKTYKKVTYWPR